MCFVNWRFRSFVQYILKCLYQQLPISFTEILIWKCSSKTRLGLKIACNLIEKGSRGAVMMLNGIREDTNDQECIHSHDIIKTN